MSRSLWWTVGAAITVAAILIGGFTVWNLLGRSTQHAETQQHTEWQGITRIVFADFEDSDVSVLAGQSGEVRITRTFSWSTSKPTATEQWDGQTLQITNSCGRGQFWTHCAIDYTVELPANVTVEAATSAGDIAVRGITGELRLSSTSGEIDVTDVSGPLTTRSASGGLTARGLTSKTVDIENVSGDVDLRFTAAPSSAAIRATSGEVAVTVPREQGPYRVATSTTSGDQQVTVEQSPTAVYTITVNTTSGDIRVANVGG
jgi:hypothetical protein